MYVYTYLKIIMYNPWNIKQRDVLKYLRKGREPHPSQALPEKSHMKLNFKLNNSWNALGRSTP